jgi:hypothetical protein
VSPVKYEQVFYIPEDDILQSRSWQTECHVGTLQRVPACLYVFSGLGSASSLSDPRESNTCPPH